MGFIKTFIGKYASYLLIGLALTAASAIWYQDVKIGQLETTVEKKNKKITTLEIANESALSAVKNLQDDIDTEQKKLSRVIDEKNKIEQNNRVVEEELEKAKGRQDVVWRKPTLVERMVQSSYNEFADSFACTTGAEEKCSEQ